MSPYRAPAAVRAAPAALAWWREADGSLVAHAGHLTFTVWDAPRDRETVLWVGDHRRRVGWRQREVRGWWAALRECLARREAERYARAHGGTA